MHRRLLYSLFVVVLVIFAFPGERVGAQEWMRERAVGADAAGEGTVTTASWAWMNPPPYNTDLNDVECLGYPDRFCLAVGERGTILWWGGYGTDWVVQESGVKEDLLGIDCLSETLCKAVGESGIILGWNGAQWVVERYTPGEILSSISCPSETLCKAVGETKIYSWNGSGWAVDKDNLLHGLSSISCATTTWCKAVGYDVGEDVSTQMIWDGSAWIVDTPGIDLDLTDVACVSSTMCMAVGLGGEAAKWDETGWTASITGVSHDLNSVVCIFSGSCYAAGAWGSILEWHGGSSPMWIIFPPKTGNHLNSISCPSTTFCGAVGVNQVLVYRDGGSWNLPYPGSEITLNDIVCPAPDLCMAVDSMGTIYHWNGTAWTRYTTSATEGFNDIDCSSPERCKAVGANGKIYQWNGNSWGSISSGTSYDLWSISCPSDSKCKVVGSGGTLLSWNGSLWSTDTSGSGVPFRAVHCPTDTDCMVVNLGGNVYTLDGNNWNLEIDPVLLSSYDLTGVHCAASGYCKVVGYDNATSSDVILTYDGSGWSKDDFSSTTLLRDVFCTSSTECIVAGDQGLIKRWNGTAWGDEVKVDLPENTHLNGVHCQPGGYCAAVGSKLSMLARIPQTLTNVDDGFKIEPFFAGCLTGINTEQTNGNPLNAQPGMVDGRYWTITAEPATCTGGGRNVTITLPTNFLPGAAQRACQASRLSGWYCTATRSTAVSVTRDNMTAFGNWVAQTDRVNTRVELTSDPEKGSISGDTVMFAARVEPAAGTVIPTGTVTFFNGKMAIANCAELALDGKGNASCQASGLALGEHTIRAEYNGDLRYNPSLESIRHTVVASSDAALKSLVLSSGELEPGFAQNVTGYTAVVANSADSISVTPTANHFGATIRVDGAVVASGSATGAIALSVGANPIEVEVTAQDGTTKKVYTVTVTRQPSTDAALSALALSSGSLSPGFAPETTGYTASVPNETASISVTATANHAGATITVNGAAVGSGSPSGAVSLDVGENVITVIVKAQDGTTTRTYTVTVTRAEPVKATQSSVYLPFTVR